MGLFAVLELRLRASDPGASDQLLEMRRREGDRLEVAPTLVFAVSALSEERVVLDVAVGPPQRIELAIGERARFAFEFTECVLRLIAIRSIDARTLPGSTPLERELLAAIRAAPDDDQPRIVYADWLLSQSSRSDCERGELIQLQCARLKAGNAEQRRAIRARERALIVAHPPPSLGEGIRLELAWSRGFLERCRGEFLHFAQNVTKVFEVAPSLSILDLEITGWGINQSLIGRLASIEEMAQIRDLSIVAAPTVHYGDANDVLIRLVPALTSLRRLRLRASALSLAGIEGLLGARVCPQLALLDLSGNTIDQVMARALAESTQLEPSILRLADCAFGPAQVEILGSSSWFAELEELDLGTNSLRDDGAIALSKVPFKRLRTLAIGSCKIGKTGGAALLASHHLAKLRCLRVHGNPIGDGAAKALAKSRLRSIQDLDMHTCAIREAGARALADSTNLRALRRLQLGGNRIGDGGARAIAESQGLPNLEKLEVVNCGISDDGARALLATSLRRIVLSTGELSEEIKTQLRDR